jgi:hypothetical protein
LTKAKNRKCRNSNCFFIAIFRKLSGHTTYVFKFSIQKVEYLKSLLSDNSASDKFHSRYYALGHDAEFV